MNCQISLSCGIWYHWSVQPTLIIDFDSTFVSVESLDELAAIALATHPERAEKLTELTQLTDQGMAGTMGFGESLARRLQMFEANRGHVDQLVSLLRGHITASLLRNQAFLREQAARIYIISGGFSDYIVPVAVELGLRADHILANNFIFDPAGNIIGYDQSRPLAQDNGKVTQIATMNLSRPIYVIGDGYTDYTIKAAGQAEKFLVFVENIRRDKVVQLADEIWENFDGLAGL